MHPVVYYIFFFLAIGAAGMALGSRNASPEVRKQRWLKYFTYIFFTGVVVLGIFFNFIVWVGVLISIAAMAEIIRVNSIAGFKPALRTVISCMMVALVCTGFLLFASTFHYTFLIYSYFQVMVFDGFSQITGQLFGRHVLAPHISPSKTWEGLMGGTLFCTGVAVASADWIQVSYWEGALFGIVTACTGFAGDMLASWYKRKTGVKDYSNWLPGQGGFLDRFDSFLATGCVYYLSYILIFKNILEPFIK